MIDFERGERAEGERAQKELSGRQYHDLNKHPRQSVESVFVSPLREFFRTRIYRIQRMLRSVGGTVFQTKLGNG